MTIKMNYKTHKQIKIRRIKLKMTYKKFMKKDWQDNSNQYKSKNHKKRYSIKTSKMRQKMEIYWDLYEKSTLRQNKEESKI